MARREYILAADPYVLRVSGIMVREVKERVDSGPWQAILVVAQDSAMDVLEALRHAYQDGREDHAEDEGIVSWAEVCKLTAGGTRHAVLHDGKLCRIRTAYMHYRAEWGEKVHAEFDGDDKTYLFEPASLTAVRRYVTEEG